MRRFFFGMAVLVAALPVSAQQDPVHELDGLVVTGVPQPRAQSLIGQRVSILSGVDLRARGIVHVVDALREVPGVALVEGGSFGSVSSVFMRGAESDYVQVLIDGVPVNQPGGAFDFSGLTTENVERIEVLRGPASALYGSDAIAGVVHVITRGGSGEPTGSLSALGGSFGRRDLMAELRGSTGSVSYGFGVAEYGSDGILEFNNRFRNRVLSGVVRLVPDHRSRVVVSTRLGQREYHFPTDASGNVVDRNAFTYADEFTLGLDLSRRLSDRAELELLLSSHDSDDGMDDAADGPADTLGFYGYSSLNSLRRTRARAQSHLELVDGTVGTLGVEASSQSLRAFNESQSEFGPSSGRSDNERWNRSVFGHLATSLGRLGANAGLRLEDNERFGRAVTWQLGASWALTSSTRARFAAGSGIKEPTLAENYATGFAVGNPDLEPERSVSWEVGVDRSLLGGAVVVAVGWFDQRFEDLIQYTFTPPQPGGSSFYNVAEARARGLEAEASIRIGTVRVSGDATWLDTEVVDAGFDSGPGDTFVAGQPLLRRPELVVGGSVAYTHAPSGRVTLGVRRVGGRDDRDFSTFPATPVTLDPYTLVSFGAELDVLGGPTPGVTLSVRGENLLDQRHEEVFGFLRPGRAVYLGVRVGLGRS